MKKILFIAPSSYPVNGAEAIVNVKLLRALTESGEFTIDLVSKTHKWQNYPANDTLDSLCIKLRSYHTITVDNKMSIRVIFEHILAFLIFGATFKGAHWAYKALGIIKKLIRENQYDYVITKDSPSILLGAYIKKKFGLKWIATWNDPYPISMYPPPYGSGNHIEGSFMDKRLIKIMQRFPDIHIFPSKRLRDYMNYYLKIPESKTRIVPHVVFNNKKIIPNHSASTLKFIHSGNLRSPRDPRTFIDAFGRFVKDYPLSKVEFHILGVLDNGISQKIKLDGLSKYIKILSPVSYSESLKLLENYHVAVIIEANCEEGVFLPTKVSDFMENKIRIFAVSPACGVLNDLYISSNITYFSPVNDVDAIYEKICEIYKDFIDGKLEGAINDQSSNFAYGNIVDIYKSF